MILHRFFCNQFFPIFFHQVIPILKRQGHAFIGARGLPPVVARVQLPQALAGLAGQPGIGAGNGQFGVGKHAAFVDVGAAQQEVAIVNQQEFGVDVNVFAIWPFEGGHHDLDACLLERLLGLGLLGCFFVVGTAVSRHGVALAQHFKHVISRIT